MGLAALIRDDSWRTLALLFFIRTAMAFQLATVGALGPLIGETFEVDAAGVGLLVGLYLSPGVLIALPSGAIGRALGDKRAVLIGLALMTAGGATMAFGNSWEAQLLGRLASGVGGVLLNVLMTKMVTDLFAGRALATAMALFINSFPFGIALALLAQPFVAAAIGLAGAIAMTAALSAASFAALLFRYHPTPTPHVVGSGFPRGAALVALLIAGMMWALYNVAATMLFGFSPLMLTERGWTLEAASSATSIAIWLVVVSVPLGGLIADRTGRPKTTMVFGFALAALTLFALARLEATLPVLATMVLCGAVTGLPVGSMLALPSRVLAPETRALGMGLFLTLYYATAVIAPPIAGGLIDVTGFDGAAMDFGGVMLLACIPLLAAFERAAGRATP